MQRVLRVETYRSGTSGSSSRSAIIPSISHIWRDFNEEEAETNINFLSTSALTPRKLNPSRLVNEATLMDVKLGQSMILNLERPWDESSSKDCKLGHARIHNATKLEQC